MNDKAPSADLPVFWSLHIDEAFRQVNSQPEGLNEMEIKERKNKYGVNAITSTRNQTAFLLFLNQFKSPITIILLFASILSYILQDKTNALIILLSFLSAAAWNSGRRKQREMPLPSYSQWFASRQVLFVTKLPYRFRLRRSFPEISYCCIRVI